MEPRVTWGPNSPSPKECSPSPILVHVYCGQTAGWIKMALGTKVGLGPGHVVLDAKLAPPPQNGGITPNFRPISVVAKRLYASRCHFRMEVGLGPGDC